MNIPKLIKEAHENAIDKGFYDCPECEGSGEIMKMVCYGGSPSEKTDDCENCDGEGIDPNKNIGELLMLIVSELGEALEAHRNGVFANNEDLELILRFIEKESKTGIVVHFPKIKDTFEDEIADVFIRLFDLCGYLNIEPSPNIPDSFKYNIDNTGEILLYISNNILNIKQHSDREYYISISIYYLWCAAVNNFSIDIEKHIEAKMEYNKTREHKHGKEY